jgi:hypothetical protein
MTPEWLVKRYREIRGRYRWYHLIWPFKQIGFWLARRRAAKRKPPQTSYRSQYLD